MRYNRNPPTNSCQGLNNLIAPAASEAIENPVKHFDSYTPKELKVVDYLLWCHSRGILIKDAVSVLAKRAGVSTATFSRAKAKLVDAGLVDSFQTHCFSLCNVKVSSFFLKTWVRICLSYFLPALKILPLVSLLSVNLEALARKQITSQVRYIKPMQRNSDRHINIKYVYKDINYTLPSYVTNDEPQNQELPFASSSQNVKKGFNMSGILANVMGKLGEDRHVEPAKTSPRDMLEPEVFQIKEIPLTKWGQIRFCAFPAHIISKARLSFNKNLTGLPAFNSLFMEALTHCRKENIEPDWKRVQYLSVHFKQPDNAPMILNSSPLGIPDVDNMSTTENDDAQISRDVASTPRSPKCTIAASPYKPAQHTHKRPEYIPYEAPQSEERPEELIYAAYFTVEDGYKASGNPLGFPNRYKKRYEQFLADALASTDVTRETMESELYDMYLKQKRTLDV